MKTTDPTVASLRFGAVAADDLIFHLGWLSALGIGCVWMAATLLWASPAPFIIDGVIYQAMADAAAHRGSFFLDNGYADTGLAGLRLHLTVLTDGRLAGQYPGGWGFIAAPAYLLGGVRGLMVFNTLAGMATLVLIWRLGHLLFSDARIALGGVLLYGVATFALDYTIAVWPHAPATLTVTAALTAAVAAWRRPEHGALWMALAGLAIGLGLNIRIDVLFPALGIVAWVMMTGARPYAQILAFTAGLIPGFGAAMAVNWVKFGSLSPVDYGAKSGNTTASAFGDLAPIIALGVLFLILIGRPEVRRIAYRPAVAGGAALLAVIAILAVPQLSALALRMATGFWILVVDFQDHPYPALGMVIGEDGVMRAFRLMKKALLQSEPFLPILLALIPLSFAGRRAEYGLIGLGSAAVILPFTLNSWHGGGCQSMRYFMNALPLMAIGSATAFLALSGRSGQSVFRIGLGGFAAILLAALGWELSALSFFTYWQVELPLALAAVTALAALVAFAPAGIGRAGAFTAQSVCIAGVFVAAITAWVLDARETEGHRGFSTRYIAATAQAPENALIVAYLPKTVAMRLNQPGAMLATPFEIDPLDEPKFLDVMAYAWANERPIWTLSDPLTQRILDAGLASGAEPVFPPEERVQIYRLSPPKDKARTDG